MSLEIAAEALLRTLRSRGLRVVFAESCTGGLVSATMARIPGVSEWLCGSAVTYREQTKEQWLSLDPDEIRRHTAVSEPVAKAMALHVLERTPEAAVSASVTGHLGPDAPAESDGVVWIAVAWRLQDQLLHKTRRGELKCGERAARQREASEWVLRLTAEIVEDLD
jgi:PncC family amidohydrolase